MGWTGWKRRAIEFQQARCTPVILWGSDRAVHSVSPGWTESPVHPHVMQEMSTGPSTVVQALPDLTQVALEARVLTHQLGDLLDRVQGGGVVTSTKGSADDRQ